MSVLEHRSSEDDFVDAEEALMNVLLSKPLQRNDSAVYLDDFCMCVELVDMRVRIYLKLIINNYYCVFHYPSFNCRRPASFSPR